MQMRIYKKGCPLCEARKLTRWYYEGDHFWIADCEICGAPIIVAKGHKKNVPKRIRDLMKEKAREIFGKNIDFQKEQRRIKDHFHWHIIRFY